MKWTLWYLNMHPQIIRQEGNTPLWSYWNALFANTLAKRHTLECAGGLATHWNSCYICLARDYESGQQWGSAAAALEQACSRDFMVWMIPPEALCSSASFLLHWAARLYEGKLQWKLIELLSRAYCEPEHVGWQWVPQTPMTTTTC